MTEITPPITPSINTNTNNNSTTTTTTTITPPIAPNDNGSEYQRSYSWKLPMVTINRPKERTKSEYQREFTWKNDPPSTPSPAPSPAPIAPSPIPQDSFTACNTPEPIKSITTTNNNIIDHVGSKLNDLKISNNSSTNINDISKHNGNFVSEPEEKFSSNNNADKWKDGLRNSESKQSPLASNLDPRTKKIVALEANRLSKKSRSYSMYSLHDQLKVNETADDLSNPYDTEYNREFVNWKEYGTAVREDTMANKKSQTTSNDHTLRRRGSWSSSTPSPAPLPAPLKWLEDLNIDLGSRVSTREKLQPTITDSKSIRGITTTITAKSPSRSTRDYYYDEKRPTTSAEIRDYRYERPTTSADVRDYSRPATSFRDYRYEDYDDDDYYNSKRNLDNSKNYHNPTSLRPSTTMSYYKDTTSQYYDDRNYNSSSNSKRNDYYYDDRKYDDRKYDDRKYDDRKYDDQKYDDRKYDDRKYDDRKYDDRKYDDRKREISKRDSIYDDRRRDDDYQRDHSTYDYDYHRHANDDPKYNVRGVQTSDREHYNLGHSRNTSYASSNKGSVHDEPTNFSGAPSIPYLDAMRHRSSVSSLSSASTPSSPATPTGYDINDFRWKRNNGLDPRIYKEQNYSPSVISKSSSSSHGKYWQFEDEKDRYYHPSSLSPSRNKFYVDEEDDDESLGGYSSKRQSHDYKPSGMRYSTQISPTPTRSSSPSRDSYGSGRRHYQRSTNYTSYSSRPPSRATSVSSHATSIEEESAVLTDILKEAELMTLKNLTDQMSIFKPRDLSGIGVTSGRATPSVASSKRSSLVGQKKSTTTTTTAAAAKKTGVKSKTVPQTKTPTKTPTRTPTKTPTKTSTTRSGLATTNKGIPPNTKKGHRPSSSLSSTTSSYREAYQDYTRPPPTNFSAAREALSRARMKVEEMLEIVSNGGSLD